MLERLIVWCLHHRLVVIAATLGLVLTGVLALRHLPLDAFPDTTPVLGQGNTVAPSLGPVEVERQLTFPVEQVLGGLPGLREVRSLSRFGLSQVVALFDDGTDLYRARQMVSERIAAVRLPAGVRPTLGPISTGLGEVVHYLLSSADPDAAAGCGNARIGDHGRDPAPCRSGDARGSSPGAGIAAGSGGRSRSDSPRNVLTDLRTLQDWEVAPRLRSLAGVAEVNAWGGKKREIHVVVDPEKLREHHIPLETVVATLEASNLNVGGGALVRGGESALIHGMGLVQRPKDLEGLVVAMRGTDPIRIGALGRVAEGAEIRRGAVTASGTGEAVLGLAFVLVGESSADVAHRVRLRLAEIARTLPAGVTLTPVHVRTDLVDAVLATVRTNLLEGAALVVAVLFVFLGHLRAGLIVAAAIPLSMLFAVDLMTRAGIAGSLMSLGAIDFGLVVDSSVIMVENAMRRLDQEAGTRPRLDVVRDAALEVRRPTLFGELIIMAVYLPILLLEGVEGKLFRPMAATVIFALLGSMILSVTLMPVLCSLALPRKARPRRDRLGAALRWLYRPVVRASLRVRWLVLLLAAGGGAAAAVQATRLGAEFVPRLNEGTIVINTIRLAGVSLDESVRYGTRIERALLAAFPDEVERIWSRTGTPEVATDPMGLEVTDVFVSLRPRAGWTRARSQPELVSAMESLLADLPGMRAVFTQPIEMRMNEMIAGIRSDVGIKLFGDDFAALEAKAEEIAALVKTIPGAADVVVEQLTGQPTVRITVDYPAIARHGIRAAEVLALVEALGRREVGVFQDGERRVPIVLRLPHRYRRDLESLGRIQVTAASGDRVALSDLAHIERVVGPSSIQREWGRRRIVVQANVRGRDVASFVADVQSTLRAKATIPPGMWVTYGGQFEHLVRGRQRLLLVVPLALLIVFSLLYITYGNALDAARVFLGIPVAAAGGILALTAVGLPFSISAGVGFVALSGVAVLGDMVFVSTFRQLRAEGLALRAAIEEAASRRLRPVLMTALVAALGFLPMATSTGIGAEVQRPLATVVIGGVVSSTLLTLLVLPAIYSFARAPRPAVAVADAAPAE